MHPSDICPPRVALGPGFRLPHHMGARLACFMLAWCMVHRPVRRGARSSDWVRLTRMRVGPNHHVWRARTGTPQAENPCPYVSANPISEASMLLLLNGGYIERRREKDVRLLDFERPWMHVRCVDAVRAAIVVVESSP